MTQTTQTLAPHPSRLSVDSNGSTVDVEKSRISVDSTSDEATIRIPFSTRKTSRKLFCAILIIANILFIALVVGLAVGLSLRLRHPGPGSESSSTSSGASSSPAGVEDVSHGGGGGSNRVY
ncbi:hypothetical protein TWF192_005342 [Orbilia oligospora]|uniref:Uncharacterized protein n=1 Tax=Orbilia oligospora TaxID=2813651 RepID=A0A6G1MA89_ORBOL|nr:hypothetical protein TWF679_002146 [Orbilia oligospora]KAF3250321.1 hypothetical protein TWF192_005342 [Orbilia oligospora]